MAARIFCLMLLWSLSFSLRAEAFGTADSFWADFRGEDTRAIDHGAWQRFLDEFLVTEGQPPQTFVAYQRVSPAMLKSLRAYLADLQAIPIRTYHRDEQRAYWINLYNAKTVELILAHYPVSSIRDIRPGWFALGPWKEKVLTVEGKPLSLDDIEHRILRPLWRDNRIHYAVNCASLGCPNLAAHAFTRTNTERLLDTGARDFINHPRGVRIDGNALILSRIYDWFDEDFGRDFAALKKHLLQYAAPAMAAGISSATDADYEYDWSLNEAR